MAVALALAFAPAGEAATSKQDPLIGATRAAVIAKFGEPRNTMVAGSREVLFFERERVTLRDNVVIAVEPIAAEPVRRAPPTPSAAATSSASASDQPASVTPPTAAASESTTASASPQPATSASSGSSGGNAPTVVTPPAPVAPPAPDANAPLEIRVRPAGARSISRSETPAPVATDATTPAAATSSAPAPAPARAPVTTSVAPVAEKATAPATPASVPSTSASVPPPASTSTTPTPAAADSANAAASAKKSAAADASTAVTPPEAPKAELSDEDAIKQKAKIGLRRARRAAADALEDDLTEVQHHYLAPQTYVIAAITVGAGVAFLLWRKRQRQLELAASAVSRTPFSAPVAAATGGGAVFAMDLVGKLEWKRFEELVASYYSKTGVVASRTKTGPASPVHIKISWKGESRPFALVQCLSHPAGLIDARPLQELVAVLAAEDIRRGYVVTTGKFNVPARDFAEEKHITLLPGDIFLEKINALPDAARNELMSEVTNGDYTTPSCPKCEAKMVRNPDDSSQWRCAAHPDQVIPVK